MTWNTKKKKGCTEDGIDEDAKFYSSAQGAWNSPRNRVPGCDSIGITSFRFENSQANLKRENRGTPAETPRGLCTGT